MGATPDPAALGRRIDHHLRVLVDDVGPRPPGSPANRRATDHLAASLAGAGRDVARAPFTTRWWRPGPGELRIGRDRVTVQPNPYSPPCDVTGRVVRLESRADLVDDPRLADAVIVLGPELAGDTLMPAAFPFLRIPEHLELVAFLTRHAPRAVIGVSDRHRSIPTLEDPDVGLPSTTVGPDVGARLVDGSEVGVRLSGSVHGGDGVNVSSPAPDAGPRIVLSAHVDAKATTPGAFDNAASVAVLLALAETAPPADLARVELVFFNGEDHFDACGEQAWLAATDLGGVAMNVNLDGVGVAGRTITATTLACPPAVERALARLVADMPDVDITEPWVESDHALFAQRGVPAVAVTSAGVHDLLVGLAHTPDDTRAVVDVDVCVGAAAFVRAWLGRALPVLDRAGREHTDPGDPAPPEESKGR